MSVGVRKVFDGGGQRPRAILERFGGLAGDERAQFVDAGAIVEVRGYGVLDLGQGLLGPCPPLVGE